MAREIPLRDRQGRQVAVALVDDEDYEDLARFRWYRDTMGYVRRTAANEVVYMHRYLLGLEPGMKRWGDHINRDRLDNRRGNLRSVAPSESGQNVRARSDTPRGVSRLRVKGRLYWRARYGTKHIGLFPTAEDAGRAASEYRAIHAPLSDL